MASPGSFIRSAARATSSAYRRLPIRWRLAGGSALLTLVILCGFAVIVGVLTTGRIEDDFDRQVVDSANRIAANARLLGQTSPAGLEAFFRELAAAHDAGTLGPDAYASASQRYGITWLD